MLPRLESKYITITDFKIENFTTAIIANFEKVQIKFIFIITAIVIIIITIFIYLVAIINLIISIMKNNQ